MSKLYDIHPWKVQFIDSSMEEAYQENKFLRIKKALIVLTVVMLISLLFISYYALGDILTYILDVEWRSDYLRRVNTDVMNIG